MKDGGPAFPRAGSDEYGNETQPFDGMSLRDYFAAKAMAAFIIAAGPAHYSVISKGVNALNTAHAALAEGAYHMADAMLAASELKPKGANE